MENGKLLTIEVLGNGMHHLEVSDETVKYCFEYDPNNADSLAMAQEFIGSIFTEEELQSILCMSEEL